MTPEERKAAARRELARRELKRRGVAIDDGVSPAVVEEPSTVSKMLSGMDAPVGEAQPTGTLGSTEAPDNTGWFPDSDRWPGQTLAKETVGGLSSGIENIPNAVPNIVNAGKSLHDLHFGKGTGEVAPKDQWKQWMGPEGFVDYPFTPTDELHPPTPGWEDTRHNLKMAGSVAPAGPLAMVAAPLLANAGGGVGRLADIFTGNENRKWEQTGETALPLLAGGLRATAGAMKRAGKTLPSPGIGSYALMYALDPSLPAAVAGAKVAGKVLSKGSQGSLGKDIAGTMAQAVAPMAVDDPRMRGPR